MDSDEVNYEPSSKEENIIWDLEVWKRAEQTKFKAYLKQLEYEFLNKIGEEFNKKEEDREKEVKQKINELNVLQTRLKKKMTELEARESKVNLLEEELKIRINDVARQLANKEEEISYIKNRHKEEKKQLEKEKQNLQRLISEKERYIEEIESNFRNYKKEIDDSPISVLKNELNRKGLEYEDLFREKSRVEKDKDNYKQICEKLKVDLIKMKKNYENEKEQMYKQKIDEIEKLRYEIYNQKLSQNELLELQELRLKVKNILEVDNKNSQDSNVNHKKEYKIIPVLKKNSRANSKSYSELEKLYKEKEILLNTGQYNEKDPLIIKIDSMIKNLEN